MNTIANAITRIAAGIAILSLLAFSNSYKEFTAAVAAENQATIQTVGSLPVLPNS